MTLKISLRNLVFLFILILIPLVLILRDPSDGDWIDEYKRKLKSGPLNSTVDCVSWEPVEILQHNIQDGSKRAWIMKKKFETESSEHRKESFAKVYENNEWGMEAKSGPGSLLINAWRVIDVLNILIEKIKKKTGKDQISLLDSSCGDMSWMPTFLENRTDVDFTGYDIVPANIENHKKNFADYNWKFEVQDMVAGPISKFDIILSRHTMIHLKSEDTAKALKNFYDSGSTYLLATNFPELKANIELSEDGYARYHQVNLHLSPFYLPPPVCQSNSDGELPFMYIALWKLDML
eukprot:GFUD01065616.1.p1 GENE.GFUD01065616.1~~GFUD01065616.1.p1  ORF type:complete len:293 (-),score=77.32 GFUD01065616.1:35-913(-)